MKISIITICFNSADTIFDTMQSVHSQDYQNFEHIIQDGGSSDGTLRIIKTFSDVSYNLMSSPDSGIYDGLNKGILRASGDIIGLMHSNDMYKNESILNKVAEAFLDHDADGVYGDLELVSKKKTDKIVRKWRSGPYRKNSLKYGWMPPHPALYLRREVFEKFGLYDPSFTISGDYEAILRFLVHGDIKLKYIPETFVKMRAGGKSNGLIGNMIQKKMEDYRAIRRHHVGGLGTLFSKNIRKIHQFF